MKEASIVLVYVAMLIFDAAVMAGAAYLVVVRDRPGWWMVLALLLIAGSSPTKVVEALRRLGTQ